MLALRQAAWDAGITAVTKWTGWGVGDRSHHCLWHHITCDGERRVTRM